MTNAGELLRLRDTKSVVSVIGCGGKSTFIESLADELQNRRVLISPTTKMYPPTNADIICTDLPSCRSHRARRGITAMGVLDRQTGKLCSLPPSLLSEIASDYDIVLLESDGSRGLPCKGWRSEEPVIPPFSTHTVMILTLDALGLPANEKCVFNLPGFLELTGLSENEPITTEALCKMAVSSKGEYLLLNRCEDEKTESAARSFLENIAISRPGRFKTLAYGSARNNRWIEVSI